MMEVDGTSEFERGADESLETRVERGRWTGTPFAALGAVATGTWFVVAVVTAAVLLIWWLA
jgi:hypothetical protein